MSTNIQLELRWPDPTTHDADEPLWAVWETRCGTYRVVYDAATDSYAPMVLRTTARHSNSKITERWWASVYCEQPTLEQAMQAVNEYHCKKYKLILTNTI